MQNDKMTQKAVKIEDKTKVLDERKNEDNGAGEGIASVAKPLLDG